MLVGLLFGVVALGAVEGRPATALSVEPGASASAAIPAADRPRLLSVVVAIDGPGRLKPGVPVEATLAVGPATLKKVLHLGDPDVAWLVRPESGQPATVTLKADPGLAGAISCTVRTAEHAETPGGVAFEHEPNDTPAAANRLDLGRTVYGLADDRPYLPLGETPTPAEQSAGQDWYRLDFASETHRLLYVGIDYIDRDVPPDVRVYTLDPSGKPVEYTRGIDPQSLQAASCLAPPGREQVHHPRPHQGDILRPRRRLPARVSVADEAPRPAALSQGRRRGRPREGRRRRASGRPFLDGFPATRRR